MGHGDRPGRQSERVWVLSNSGDFRLLPADPAAEALRYKTRELTAAERAEFEVPARP